MVLQSLLYLIGFCWDCSCTSSGIPEQPSAHRSPGTHSHFRLFCLVPAIISHQDQINMHIMIGLRYWFLRRHFPNYKNGRFDFCEGLAFMWHWVSGSQTFFFTRLLCFTRKSSHSLLNCSLFVESEVRSMNCSSLDVLKSAGAVHHIFLSLAWNEVSLAMLHLLLCICVGALSRKPVHYASKVQAFFFFYSYPYFGSHCFNHWILCWLA